MLPEEYKAQFTNKAQQQKIENAMEFVKQIKTENSIYNYEFATRVANILLHVMADYHSVISAFYYPFYTTNKLSLEEIGKQTDKEVVEILSSLLKVEQLKINTRQAQAQNIKNMFIALAKDIRVIILKLAIEQQKVAWIEKFSKPEQQSLIHDVKEI